jgi:nitrate/nitrite-specific signal transduction histidine kinase/PAS domain-containing protein
MIRYCFHCYKKIRSWLLVPALVVLLSILLVSASAKASASANSPSENPELLVLTDAQGKYPLGLHLQILDDPSGSLTIEQVSSPAFDSKFIPSQVPVPNYGYTDHVYWLRLDLLNDSSVTNQWFLESYFQNLNYVDLYLPATAGGFTRKESGALRPFGSRDILYYHVVFKLPLSPGSGETVYLRVKSGSSMTLSFILWSPEDFAVNKIVEMLLVGLFYGSLLMILGYHIFLYLSLKELSYLYFVLFLASSILFFASYEGIADQFLWPGLAEAKKYTLATTMSLFFIAALKFSDVFLEQKARSPRLHKILNAFLVYWLLMIVILPFFSYGFISNITSLGLLLTPAFAAVCGFYHWRKGNHPARFYLVSWLGFMVGIILAELVRDGTISSTPLTENSYQIGLLWLVLLWSLALADRINILKAQTENANARLRNSEHELVQILDGIPVGVVVYGRDEMPKYANQRVTEILGNPGQGIQPDPNAGRSLAQALDYFSLQIAGTGERYPYDLLPIYRALQGQSSSVDDLVANLVDRLVPLEMFATPVKDDQGRIVSAVAAILDITQRRQTEAELVEYRKLLEALVEKRTADLSAINGWLTAMNEIHQTVSSLKDLPQAYKKLSAAVARLLDARAVFMVHWGDQFEHAEVYLDFGEEAFPSHLEIGRLKTYVVRDPVFYGEAPSGKPIRLTTDQISNYSIVFGNSLQPEDLQRFVLAPIMAHQQIDGLLGIVFQDPKVEPSHQQMLLMEKMALDIASLSQNAFLLDQSIDLAMMEERQRIARDLHDSVTQMIYSASLFSSTLPQRIRRDPGSAIETAEELHRLTRGALAEMRTLLLELRPAGITRIPIKELLLQLAEAISGHADFSLQVDLVDIPSLPEDVQIGFYRIAQEALNNIIKHAGAKQVILRLDADPIFDSYTLDDWHGGIRLFVKDDGIGFDLDRLDYGHFGLGIMRERADTMQAKLHLQSKPGEGTEVVLTWRR